MGVEYVRFAQSETVQAKRNFLESQVHLLQGLQHYKKYGASRAEELRLKIQLKQQMDALAEQLEIINRILPHSEFKLPTNKAQVVKEQTKEQASPSDYSLENDLMNIQRKLRALQ